MKITKHEMSNNGWIYIETADDTRQLRFWLRYGEGGRLEVNGVPHHVGAMVAGWITDEMKADMLAAAIANRP